MYKRIFVFWGLYYITQDIVFKEKRPSDISEINIWVHFTPLFQEAMIPCPIWCRMSQTGWNCLLSCFKSSGCEDENCERLFLHVFLVIEFTQKGLVVI